MTDKVLGSFEKHLELNLLLRPLHLCFLPHHMTVTSPNTTSSLHTPVFWWQELQLQQLIWRPFNMVQNFLCTIYHHESKVMWLQLNNDAVYTSCLCKHHIYVSINMHTLCTATFPLLQLEQAQTTYKEDKQMDFSSLRTLSRLYSQQAPFAPFSRWILLARDATDSGWCYEPFLSSPNA